MTKTYYRQADKALMRKYGRRWWCSLNRPGVLVNRVEQRIYDKRKRLADWLVPCAVALATSLICSGLTIIWRTTP